MKFWGRVSLSIPPIWTFFLIIHYCESSSLELIENNKPRVILDLSHELEDNFDEDEDFAKRNKSAKEPKLDSDSDSINKETDTPVSVKDMVIATITTTTPGANVANEVVSSNSHVNFGFVANEKF
jgi:hypothetical protein